jgi:hypothetical protein
MKKLKAATLILSLALCAAASFPARAQTTEAAREFRRGEVVVEIKPDASIEAVNARIGTSVRQRLYGTNFYLLSTPRNKKEAKYRKRLERDQDVLSASLNPVVTNPTLFGRSTFSFPDGYATPGKTQADFDNQSALLGFLQLVQAHDRSRGKGAVVAIIDTGVDLSHQQIQPFIWNDSRANADIAGDGIDNDRDGLIDDYRGWDFIENDNDPREVADDPQTTVAGHGTFIAGIIALVAPDARIMPIRAFPADGYGDEFTIASAIKYAADNGANIINLSFGTSQVSTILADAINYARDRGAVLMAASGNENSESPQFPASSPDVMAVAAIDLASRKANFSNFGPHVDVAAPGVQLISAYPGDGGNQYAMWSGTSFAAPFAVAEAALIYGLDSSHPDIRKAIEDTSLNIDAENPGYAGKLGRGRISLLRALECLNTDCARTVHDFRAEAILARAPGVTTGQGRAKVSVTGSKQEFEVTATDLNPRMLYGLFVNGSPAGGPKYVASLGDIVFKFSTEPGDSPITGAINPVTNIRHVELRNASGQIVLQGDFARLEDAPPTGQTIEKEARLLSPASRAGGKAKIEVKLERESLTIEAEGLAAGLLYQISVDGVNLSQEGSRNGYLKVVYTSDGSSGRLLPVALRPAINIRHVEVRNLNGEIALQGDFQPGTGSTGGGGGGTPATVTREARFNRIGGDPDAEGKAKIRSEEGREEFGVDLSKLEAGAVYKVVVDGFEIGSFQADGSGSLKRGWSSRTEDGWLPLPAQIRPVTGIRRVLIRTASGAVILAAEFST